MKILLRQHESEQYVWKTAKYDGHNFTVDGTQIPEQNIVSIINDNRKNYVRCSSCGKMFPKNGKKFQKHQELASTIDPCLRCHKLRTTDVGGFTRRFVPNGDGTYQEKIEQTVELYCRQSSYDNFALDSERALTTCPFRMCGDAYKMEIEDMFTKYPGVFDDIITVDKLLDNGYDKIVYSDRRGSMYVLDEMLDMYAYVNKLGIVDKLMIDGYGGSYDLWYSKRYDKLFTPDYEDKYIVWDAHDYRDDMQTIMYHINNLYK